MSENTQQNLETAKKMPFDEYIENESPKDMGDRLQKAADDYKQELEKVETIDECKEREAKIVKRLEEFDKYVATVEYELPSMVKFDNRSYTKQEIAEKIREFINKQEVKWQAALGIWQLYKLWKTPPKSISYGAYDSTLRMLGTMSFKGQKECENILVINDYFSQCNDAYAKDLTMLTYLSTLHSHILDRMKAIEKIDSPIDPQSIK